VGEGSRSILGLEPAGRLTVAVLACAVRSVQMCAWDNGQGVGWGACRIVLVHTRNRPLSR